MTFEAASNPARSRPEEASGSMDSGSESRVQSRVHGEIQSPCGPNADAGRACDDAARSHKSRSGKSRVHGSRVLTSTPTLTYAEYAELERIATDTVHSRVRRGTTARLKVTDGGPNGKPVWVIPITQLSPAGLVRWQAEQAEAAAATPGAHIEHDPGDSALTDSDDRQVARFNRDGIPVLKTDPRRVWEAGLVATRSAKTIEEFFRRRRAVVDLEREQAACKHGEKLDAARRVAHDHGMNSHTTLLTWQRNYRRHGEPALVPKWKKREGSKTVPAKLQAKVEGFYARSARPTIRQCYRYARAWCDAQFECSGTWVRPPSYHAVNRHIQRCLELRGALIEAARNGPKHFSDRYEFVVRRDESAMPLNACWVLDHRCMDTHVILPSGKIGRPWLTAISDIHSADFVGWVLRERDEVTSDAVACAMRHGILGWDVYDELAGEWITFAGRGVPEYAYIDRGKEFNAKNRGRGFSPKELALDPEHEQTLWGTLGIKRCRAIAYSARSKPIEPWFGSFAARIENLIAGWCGHNTLVKPADLEARRKRGDLLSWTQYLGVLARAIQQWRHEQPIGDRPLPPADFWAEHEPQPVNPAELDTLLLRKTEKKVLNGGITIKHGKQRPWHFMSDDPAFALLAGVELEVRWSPDWPEGAIAIHPVTGQRWELTRVDLRHESWNMMFGKEIGTRQALVLRARKGQKAGVAAYRQWAEQQLDPKLADPYGTLQAAAHNGRDIRAIQRQLQKQTMPAPPKRERSEPKPERAGGFDMDAYLQEQGEAAMAADAAAAALARDATE